MATTKTEMELRKRREKKETEREKRQMLGWRSSPKLAEPPTTKSPVHPVTQ